MINLNFLMSIDELFEQLKNPNPRLRERAMREIAAMRDENTIPRLMEILSAEDIVYRRAAVQTMGVIGIDAVPLLVESLLNSSSSVIRSSCAKALAQIALNWPEIAFPEEGLQGLKVAIEDPDPVVHIASVMALGEIGIPAFEILVEALKTTDNLAVAVSIINALGSMGDERAAELLSEMSQDESLDIYLRESATSALSRLELVIKYQQRN
jgi:bilin biosynthesis protein